MPKSGCERGRREILRKLWILKRALIFKQRDQSLSAPFPTKQRDKRQPGFTPNFLKKCHFYIDIKIISKQKFLSNTRKALKFWRVPTSRGYSCQWKHDSEMFLILIPRLESKFSSKFPSIVSFPIIYLFQIFNISLLLVVTYSLAPE